MKAEALQRKFYYYIKNKTDKIEWGKSPEFKRYEANFLKINSYPFSITSEIELQNKILSSTVVYVGDFHSFDQNAKNLERMLTALKGQNKKIIFGLEFIQQSDQIIVNHYLSGHLTEIEFLEKINYSESWKFPWVHYRPFFEWAKAYHKKMPSPVVVEKIIALNTKGSLKRRDQSAAQKIFSTLKNLDPIENYILVVFFGEMHLAKNKLPLMTEKECKKLKYSNFVQTVIHQNLDSFYWKLKKKKIKRSLSQIIKFNENEFCIQSSPPWIKYESLLYWHEHFEDDPHFDIHEYLRDNWRRNVLNCDSDTIAETIETLRQCFGLAPFSKDLNYNLHGPLHLKKILKNISALPKSVEILYRELLYKGAIFRIPGTFNFFSSNYSINKVAAICGMIISHTYSEEVDQIHETLFTKKDCYKDSLYFLILKENFLAECSKLIYNPYAKCDLYLDFKSFLKNSQIPIDRKKAYSLSLKLLDQKYQINNENIKIISKSAVFNAKIFSYYLYNYHRKKMKKIIQHTLLLPIAKSYSLHDYLKDQCLKNIDYKKMSKKRF